MRQPIVAGQFYESDPEKLKRQLKEFFGSVPDIKSNKLLAAIVPHAGYVYSGKCAAYSSDDTISWVVRLGRHAPENVSGAP